MILDCQDVSPHDGASPGAAPLSRFSPSYVSSFSSASGSWPTWGAVLVPRGPSSMLSTNSASEAVSRRASSGSGCRSHLAPSRRYSTVWNDSAGLLASGTLRTGGRSWSASLRPPRGPPRTNSGPWSVRSMTQPPASRRVTAKRSNGSSQERPKQLLSSCARNDHSGTRLMLLAGRPRLMRRDLPSHVDLVAQRATREDIAEAETASR
jgi:hypothetical protein